VVELQDELTIGTQLLLSALTKLRYLPRLSLILAQVLHHKGLHTRDSEQSFTRGVDGEAPQIACNPAASKLMSHRRRRAAPAEAIKHQVTFVG
jgi:hypothetical protein